MFLFYFLVIDEVLMFSYFCFLFLKNYYRSISRVLVRRRVYLFRLFVLVFFVLLCFFVLLVLFLLCLVCDFFFY